MIAVMLCWTLNKLREKHLNKTITSVIANQRKATDNNTSGEVNDGRPAARQASGRESSRLVESGGFCCLLDAGAERGDPVNTDAEILLKLGNPQSAFSLKCSFSTLAEGGDKHACYEE